ncbi:hypothetical protein FRB95_013053 [Tulasnella sp. JGI-2019a]|nr:hypothetical protein FRB95_013053 [Tulasnella sp. JGI-2019a]
MRPKSPPPAVNQGPTIPSVPTTLVLLSSPSPSRASAFIHPGGRVQALDESFVEKGSDNLSTNCEPEPLKPTSMGAVVPQAGRRNHEESLDRTARLSNEPPLQSHGFQDARSWLKAAEHDLIAPAEGMGKRYANALSQTAQKTEQQFGCHDHHRNMPNQGVNRTSGSLQLQPPIPQPSQQQQPPSPNPPLHSNMPNQAINQTLALSPMPQQLLQLPRQQVGQPSHHLSNLLSQSTNQRPAMSQASLPPNHHHVFGQITNDKLVSLQNQPPPPPSRTSQQQRASIH